MTKYNIILKPGASIDKTSDIGSLAEGDTKETKFTVEDDEDVPDRGRVITGEFSEETIAELRDDPEVEEIEEDEDMEILGEAARDPEPVSQTLPWGIDRIDADEVGDVDGRTVHAAVIDTGVSPDHPDLSGNVERGIAVVECSGDCSAPWDDDHDHGTHVAGTVGAIDNNEGVVGVAPNVILHAVKVLDGSGRGSFSDVADGIVRVANEGWDVINMSLGGGASSVVERAVQTAADAGVVIVAAAGNSGPCEDCVSYPAAYEECIAVSATNSDDGLASFSSQGPEVEIAAPGVDVLSTVPGGDYQRFNGTSMASPHVAGTVALAIDAEILDPRNAIGSSAEDIGLDPVEMGKGLVDALATLRDRERLGGEIIDYPDPVEQGQSVDITVEVTLRPQDIAEGFMIVLEPGPHTVAMDQIQDIDPGETKEHTFRDGEIPSDIGDGEYTLRFQDNDGTPLDRKPITVGDGGGGDKPTATVEVRMTPSNGGAEDGRLEFQVWNDKTDEAVVGANISASGPVERSGQTGHDGFVAFDPVPVGNYNFNVNHPDYEKVSGNVPGSDFD